MQCVNAPAALQRRDNGTGETFLHSVSMQTLPAAAVMSRFVDDKVFRRELIEEVRNNPQASEIIVREIANDLLELLLNLRNSAPKKNG